MTVSDDELHEFIDSELLTRRTKVMFLRNAGATWAEVAEKCGVSIATCRKDMAIVQRDINNEQPTQVVARHRAVIFDIQRANYPAMMKGDKDAAMVILRALDRESKLLGLDSPTRVLTTVSADDFSNEAARLIESIAKLDADTIKELTTHDRTPLDVEEVPLAQPDGLVSQPPGPSVPGDGQPAGGGDSGPAPDAPVSQPGVPGPAGLPDLPDDDGWSNL